MKKQRLKINNNSEQFKIIKAGNKIKADIFTFFDRLISAVSAKSAEHQNYRPNIYQVGAAALRLKIFSLKNKGLFRKFELIGDF